MVGLERGRMVDANHDFCDDICARQLNSTGCNELLQNLSRETITFRNAMNETALPMREIGSFKPGECVGGAGVHWGGATFRFLPWDFEVHLAVTARTIQREQLAQDCTSQDWGITYEELEPYYDQFEHLYGVGGKAQSNLDSGNPARRQSRSEVPRSRVSKSTGRPHVHWFLVHESRPRSFGYKPFPTPTAAMTRPYTNHLSADAAVNACAVRFLLKLSAAMGAKATPLTTVLPALLKHTNFELRTHANVIKVNLDSAKKRAVSVTYVDAQGREMEQPAELVILTSYVSTTRA